MNVARRIEPDWGGTMGQPGVDKRAITRHVLWVLVAVHVVAMVRLQHGVTGNLLSTTHIPLAEGIRAGAK